MSWPSPHCFAGYSWVVDLVLLGLPIGLDCVWLDRFTIWRHHQGISYSWRRVEKHQRERLPRGNVWIRSRLLACCRSHDLHLDASVRSDLHLCNQVPQFPAPVIGGILLFNQPLFQATSKFRSLIQRRHMNPELFCFHCTALVPTETYTTVLATRSFYYLLDTI